MTPATRPRPSIAAVGAAKLAAAAAVDEITEPADPPEVAAAVGFPRLNVADPASTTVVPEMVPMLFVGTAAARVVAASKS